MTTNAASMTTNAVSGASFEFVSAGAAKTQGQPQADGVAAAVGATGVQKVATSARQAKLAEAAQKFEGMMLEELLKPMQKAGSVSGGGFGGDDDTDDGADKSMDTFDSYGVEAMAEALARGGGFGLAKQVLRQIGNLDERGREKS